MKKNNLGAKAEFYQIIRKNWSVDQVNSVRTLLNNFEVYQKEHYHMTEDVLYYGLLATFYRLGKSFYGFTHHLPSVYENSNYTLKSLKEQDARMNQITVFWKQLYMALVSVDLLENRMDQILEQERLKRLKKEKKEKERIEKLKKLGKLNRLENEAPKKEDPEKKKKRLIKERLQTKKRQAMYSAIVNAITVPCFLIHLQQTEFEEYKDQLSLKEFFRYYEDDSHSKDPVLSVKVEYGKSAYNSSVLSLKSDGILGHFKDEFFSYFNFRYGTECDDVDHRVEILKERRSNLLKQIKYRLIMVFIHYKLIVKECDKNTPDGYIYVDSEGKKIQVPNCLCAFLYDFFLKMEWVEQPQIPKKYNERSDSMVKLRNFTSDEVDTTLPKFDTFSGGICLDLAVSKHDKSLKKLIFGPRSGMS